MECCNRQDALGLQQNYHRHGTRASVYNNPAHSPWFVTRVFYIRVTNFAVEDSTPDHLTLTYIPLGLDTVVGVSSSGGGAGGGERRSRAHSDGCVSAHLRRDRADRASEEVTYLSTDGIRISGSSVGFEVCGAGDELLLFGVLESVSDGDDKAGERKWAVRCESHMTTARRVLKAGRRRYTGTQIPTIDVYVAGSYHGSPVILTDTLHLRSPKRNDKKAVALDAIPEQDDEAAAESTADSAVSSDALQQYLQLPDFDNHVKLKEEDESSFPGDYYDPKKTSMYGRATDHEFNYMASQDDGELSSWFNAGVRVGVGISLGVCVGVGLGVGLLVTSYQASARNLKRRFF